MSLQFKQYSLVHIDFLKQEISRVRGCDCKYCTKFQLIHQELKKHKADKDCEWWRIAETWGKISIAPERETEG